MEEEKDPAVETADDNINVGAEITEETDVIEAEKTESNEQNEEQVEDAIKTDEEKISYTLDEHKKSLEEHEKEYMQKAYEGIEERVRRAEQVEAKKYKSLMQTLKYAGFETDDPAEMEKKLREGYEKQGLNIPENNLINSLTEDEQKSLGEMDAKKVIQFGETFMESRFKDLYPKFQNNTLTVRERQEMFSIGAENSKRLAKKDLMELGASTDTLDDVNFQKFASKYNSNVPIKEIYNDYQKLNGKTIKKPVSAGSLKTNHDENKVGNNLELNEWRKEAGL